MVLEAYGLFVVESLCQANVHQSIHKPKLAPKLLFLFINTFAV